jgi:hypothetical protein
MNNIAKKLGGLVHALPVMILSVIIYVFIGFAVGMLVSDLLLPTNFCHDYRQLSSLLVGLSGAGAFAWMRWNHKVMDYINTRS